VNVGYAIVVLTQAALLSILLVRVVQLQHSVERLKRRLDRVCPPVEARQSAVRPFDPREVTRAHQFVKPERASRIAGEELPDER
jgi:hypothetical protein